jgi:hypothetical protein
MRRRHGLARSATSRGGLSFAVCGQRWVGGPAGADGGEFGCSPFAKPGGDRRSVVDGTVRGRGADEQDRRAGALLVNNVLFGTETVAKYCLFGGATAGRCARRDDSGMARTPVQVQLHDAVTGALLATTSKTIVEGTPSPTLTLVVTACRRRAVPTRSRRRRRKRAGYGCASTGTALSCGPKASPSSACSVEATELFKLVLNGTRSAVMNEGISLRVAIRAQRPDFAADGDAMKTTQNGAAAGIGGCSPRRRSTILEAARNASSSAHATLAAGRRRVSFSTGVSPWSAIEKRSKL